MAGLERRTRFEETGGVRVQRRAEEALGPLRFHHTARVHDEDPVAERRGELEIVGDEEHRQLPLSPQGVEDRHDLGLDGHVERRRRFVGDEDVRVGGQLPAIITRWSMPPDSSPGYER